MTTWLVCWMGTNEQMGEMVRGCNGVRELLSFDDTQIHTEYSALMSKVMSNGNGE